MPAVDLVGGMCGAWRRGPGIFVHGFVHFLFSSPLSIDRLLAFAFRIFRSWLFELCWYAALEGSMACEVNLAIKRSEFRSHLQIT